MARNRKYRTAASRFGPALKAFLLCLLIGGSGVGYVWQKDQIRRLGDQYKDREKTLQKLEDENVKRRQELDRLHSQSFLEAQIKKYNLGLAQPQLSQVVRLPDPGREVPRQLPRELPVTSHDRQYAENHTANHVP